MLEQRPQTPISTAGEARPLALSFAQQRLWFLDQLEPNGSVYNTPIGLRFRGGPLNVEFLERSLNEIVRRHELLRASFPSVGGQPVQFISPSMILSLSVVDLASLPAPEQENEARRLANEEAERPFDLARGPLVRATLLRVAREDHVLVLTLHHIVSDEWSIGVLYRELSALYEAFFKGRSSPLAELPAQYVDFVQSQREWLQGDVLKQQLSYWKQQLEGAPTLQLPTDRPRPMVQRFSGASQFIVLPKELTEAVKALSRRGRATLFMTLLAAFKVLLGRYTGQEDIAVGSPIANRGRIEFEGLIGLFLNTLMLRTDLSRNPSFFELLARVREVAFEAYAHQDLPFEKLVEELKPERVLNQNPLFQVLFVLQTDAVRALKLLGLTASRFTVESNTTKFDLCLFLAETDHGLVARAQYNTDLFEAGTIQRMLGHFRTLLKGIVANPKQPILDLPLLTGAESHQMLVEWNNTKKTYPLDKCVHEWFEEQVKKTPEVVAVVSQDEQLTYQELDQRADRLARRLKSLGVGLEVRVGLCMGRSLETMVALLAVLKAGGAYVPLDPAFPKERLAFMLEDAQVPVLLIEERLAANLPEHRAKVIYPDKDEESIQNDALANPGGKATPANLAYVIYTSGSTGKPKAVAMTHGPLSNLINWQLRDFSQPVPARTLQFASLSFDVSFQEIFTTWCSGGTLVLMPEELRRDSVGLLRFLREKAVARVFLPFVALQQLAEAAGEEVETCTNLREIITAGEQLQTSRRIVQWLSRLKDCTLRNQYGPSESHVVTAFTPAGSPGDWPALPPIGRPISNAEIFLLDQRFNLVPVGVPGELYIGGDSLARGYLNRPELTAEKFVPNPFSTRPGARLYRTGDRARYLPDGNIEFLGRLDYQVKVRGYRIETGEIEAVLGQHPQVSETVVIARDDSPAGKRLVGYIVLRHDTVRISDLRNFLAEKLADYMIPSAFVFLDCLPLTPSGKIDRKALPPPELSRPELESAFVAPRTEVEKRLADIWADVLKLEEVGIHDNFFDLGGHSLLATQVISRLRAEFGVELPLRMLFEHPTVASLAERIETFLWAGEKYRPDSSDPLRERDEIKL